MNGVSGTRTALVGPSGCGKTTLLRMLAGLILPSSGEVFRQAKPDAIGYVFQQPTLLPWATVFDNVYMPLRLKGISRQEAGSQVNDLLKAVDLAAFADAFPRTLSGGMQMRVSIARALVRQPDLLLMDEPFAALDEMTRFALNDMLLELHREQGFTLVFVTHSIYESVYLCDSVAVMSERPGTIKGTIKTATPDNPAADYRVSGSFLEDCQAVSALLAQ